VNVNFEVMREEIRKILNSIDERDITMDSAIDELLNLHSVSDMFDFASYLDCKFDYYDNTKLGDIYTNSVTGKKFTQEQIYKDWLKQK
jgi:hypothetical protein